MATKHCAGAAHHRVDGEGRAAGGAQRGLGEPGTHDDVRAERREPALRRGSARVASTERAREQRGSPRAKTPGLPRAQRSEGVAIQGGGYGPQTLRLIGTACADLMREAGWVGDEKGRGLDAARLNDLGRKLKTRS